MAFLRTLFCLVAAVAAVPAPQAETSSASASASASVTSSAAESACTGNTASDRTTWCDYSIDTNYYDEVPDTGVTVEVHTQIPENSVANGNNFSTGLKSQTSQQRQTVLSVLCWPSTAPFPDPLSKRTGYVHLHTICIAEQC